MTVLDGCLTIDLVADICQNPGSPSTRIDGVGVGIAVLDRKTIHDGENEHMTLYGYNETTLKAVGDWVAPGDVIATVGDSGGQADTGLYFEIRRGTGPLNPRHWISRSPGSGQQ